MNFSSSVASIINIECLLPAVVASDGTTYVYYLCRWTFDGFLYSDTYAAGKSDCQSVGNTLGTTLGLESFSPSGFKNQGSGPFKAYLNSSSCGKYVNFFFKKV